MRPLDNVCVRLCRPSFDEAIATLDQLWRSEKETEAAESAAGDVAAAAGHAR